MIIYRVNIAGATPITSDWINGKAVETYKDEKGLASVGITPVRKTKFMELNAKNGWDPKLVKTEDLAIINDSTIAVGIDNDYGIKSTDEGVASASGIDLVIFVFHLKGNNKIKNYVPAVNTVKLSLR